MKLHEYQAKHIFSRFDIPVPKGKIANTAAEARQIASELGGNVIIKAQVLVGGRGLAGGIRLAKNPNEAGTLAATILGMEIKGLPVHRVLVDEAASIKEELYLGITIDRIEQCPIFMASSTGGVNIEEVAQTAPQKIVKVLINPLLGLRDYQARELAAGIDLPRDQWKIFTQIATSLWNIFTSNDATLVEINPLVLTKDKTLLALDGKITIDDNALPLHPDLAEMRDLDAEVPEEIEARKYGLTYIKMDGSIGCMVNGAGLAMATMDIIKLHYGEPANFLDIGGGANADRVSAAMRIILQDPSVKSILINIFGGITRCDEVARGILSAINDIKPSLPIIIRLAGTNANEGMKLLADKNLTTADTLVEAAKKAVMAAHGDQDGDPG
ncbi:MAG: ADP-forming succinate--CoA ligase subunit beta [Anaerolineaceae bacterium]|nr:ADP-forming succinate--CoA ligase subunit beta [Anaerolineaceae bacterium]